MCVCLCGFMIVCGNNFQCHRGGFPLCEVCICLFVCVRILSVESESLFLLMYNPPRTNTQILQQVFAQCDFFLREKEKTLA